MNLKLLNKTDKQRIISKLEQQYGITKIPHLLIQSGKDKIRGYTGALSKEEIIKLAREINIEVLGIYLFKIQEDGIRLSIDACNIFKNQISKNIIEVNDEQAHNWFLGKDFELNEEQLNQSKQKLGEQTFKILKFNNEFIGCGKLSQSIIKNFVPKERRLKS